MRRGRVKGSGVGDAVESGRSTVTTVSFTLGHGVAIGAVSFTVAAADASTGGAARSRVRSCSRSSSCRLRSFSSAWHSSSLRIASLTEPTQSGHGSGSGDGWAASSVGCASAQLGDMARRRLSSSVTLATLASAAWSCAAVGAAAGAAASLAAAAGTLCATAELSGTGSGKAVPVAAEEGSASACPMASSGAAPSASCWARSRSCAERRSWLRASSESMTDCIVSEAAGPGAGSSIGPSAGSRAARLAATAMVRAMMVARSMEERNAPSAMPSFGNKSSGRKTADTPSCLDQRKEKREFLTRTAARETHSTAVELNMCHYVA